MTNIVLVHGSWHGGWCWRLVAPILRAFGFEVFTPDLTGCGANHHRLSADITLSTHVQDIASVIFTFDLRDVVLVGHSYGGLPIAEVAIATTDRIKGVLYLDAYLPEVGKDCLSLWADDRAAEARDKLAAGEHFREPPDPKSLGISDSRMASWVKERLSAHPLRTYMQERTRETVESSKITRRYVHFTVGATATTFGKVAQRLELEGWKVERLAAPHDAMLTHPEAIAANIINFIRELKSSQSENHQRNR